MLRAIHDARTEDSQIERKVAKASHESPARVRFERHMTAEPGGKRCRRWWSPAL
jgi:hypothetical protein